MPIVTRYRWVEDQEFGNWGWLDVNAPDHFNVDPGDGRLIAHDLLEHVGVRMNNTNEDEIVALGAAVFVRGETGLLSGYHSWQDNIASDLTIEFNNIINGYQEFKPPHTKRLSDESLDDELKEIVEKAAKDYMSEYDMKMPKKFFKKGMLSFLRIGYRKAEKRYGNNCYAASMFQDIQREVERLSKQAEEYHELKITLNIQQARVKIELIDPYEDEYY